MNRPRWAIIVGWMGLIVSAWALFINLSLIWVTIQAHYHMRSSTFKTEKWQEEKTNFNQEWQHSTSDALQSTPTARRGPDRGVSSSRPPRTSDFPFKSPPKWISQWTTVANGLSAIFWFCLLIGSVGLLLMKSWAMRVVYVSAGGNLLLGLVKGGGLIFTMGPMGIPMSFSILPGFIVNLIILIMVANGDKSAIGQTSGLPKENTSPLTAPIEEIDPVRNYSDVRKVGVSALVAAVVSWFLFGSWLSLIAVIYGAYGAYLAINQKDRLSTIFLNLLAVIIGAGAKLALMKSSSGPFIVVGINGAIQGQALGQMILVWSIVLILLLAAWRYSPRVTEGLFKDIPDPDAAGTFSPSLAQAHFIVKLFQLVFIILFGWYSIGWIVALGQRLYGDAKSILLVPSFAQFALFLPLSIVFVFLVPILRRAITRFFPRYDQYHLLKNYVENRTVGLSKERKTAFWNAALLRINLPTLAEGAWRNLFASSAVAWIVFGLTFIPLMDNYVKVGDSGVVANSLWSFRETVLPLEGMIATLDFAMDPTVGFKTKFLLSTPQGARIDLGSCIGSGSAYSTNLQKIATVLKDHHVVMKRSLPEGRGDINLQNIPGLTPELWGLFENNGKEDTQTIQVSTPTVVLPVPVVQLIHKSSAKVQGTLKKQPKGKTKTAKKYQKYSKKKKPSK